MSAIELVLERNRSAARPLGRGSFPKLCVLTCDDPALTGQLEQVLGLGAGDAVMVRLPAGGGALSTDLVQRVVAKAVYVNDCDEVLVLTHSSCTLYELRADKLMAALDRGRVSRASVPGDLRELVGAGRDPREAARLATDALRRSELLPETLLVHLGHLDEETGRLQLVENGEHHKVTRARASGATPVAGYQGGPSDLGGPPPATVLAQVPNLAPSIQLTAPEVPTIQAFQHTPIAVTLPEVTTVLQRASVADSTEMTSNRLFGEAQTQPLDAGVLNHDTLFGGAPATPPAAPAPRRQKPEPRRQEARAPAPARRRTGDQPAIRPELANAMQKIRTFMAVEIPKLERRQVAEEIQKALAQGATTEELVKIALRPVLQSGSARYKVIDELILFKDDLVRLPPLQAAALIRDVVP